MPRITKELGGRVVVNPSEAPKLLEEGEITLKDLAQYLGVVPSIVNYLLKTGALTPRSQGKNILFQRGEVEEWLIRKRFPELGEDPTEAAVGEQLFRDERLVGYIALSVTGIKNLRNKNAIPFYQIPTPGKQPRILYRIPEVQEAIGKLPPPKGRPAGPIFPQTNDDRYEKSFIGYHPPSPSRRIFR